ncbi:succinate dehydrogenase cytochrome b subunit [Oscillatoria laete-virens NRMC-F 0139]|nr:succinate dehydrogenase cytochrome b subunit [Oscillatoria laete-virens]MDL5053629.1 succinate dehydrogenase cytochrome b subunit [Oscillatoria laete-virens NRMC-F 0139]
MVSFLKMLLTTSVGRKYIVGLTGLALVAFAIVHMVGNLQMFAAPDKINAYAVLLKSNAFVLWGFRLGLLACAALHIYFAIALWKENKAAKQIAYADGKVYKASLASRSMAVSGLIVLAFIIFHILHFTTMTIFPEYATLETELNGRYVHDVYAMVVQGFSVWWISAFYIVAVGLLSVHLSHGISSIFQSLGLKDKKNECFFDAAAKVVAVILFLGFASIPVGVLAGVIKEPADTMIEEVITIESTPNSLPEL